MPLPRVDNKPPLGTLFIPAEGKEKRTCLTCRYCKKRRRVFTWGLVHQPTPASLGSLIDTFALCRACVALVTGLDKIVHGT